MEFEDQNIAGANEQLGLCNFKTTNWQDATVLHGLFGVTEEVWKIAFPEIERDSRKTQDYRRILSYVDQLTSLGLCKSVLKLKQHVEQWLNLSPNIAEQRIQRLIDMGLLEKVRNVKNKRQKFVVLTSSARDRMQDMGAKLAAYLGHLNSLVLERGPVPHAANTQTTLAYDPLPIFVGADGRRAS